jgi:two-component system, OmpR family, KDP operon response regulator KdpE
MMQARGRMRCPPAPAIAARSPRILIVEDEPALQRALEINLRARGYDVVTASTGRQALAQAARRPPDAILLDLGLPDADGTEVIRDLRERSAAPVIVLSGRTGSGDKIGALDAGADDYVTKPFSMEELLARLRAGLRRDDRRPSGPRVSIGRCTIDLTAYTVLRAPDAEPGSSEPGRTDAGRTEPGRTEPGRTDAGRTDASSTDAGATARPVHLTPTEWRLLEILLDSPGQLVSSTALLTEVWGPGFERSTHYLRFHMARLRRKLEDDPPRPRHLLTEPGMGYRYQP